ncbi:MAG: hypothetical protein Q8O85_18790 [Rhodoferax sp.]|uniref:hypothetical protein n=1 Tax=Rhodoferax sp. TaxID=50421 RepID=UPI002733EF32|nr:hypothetical protein [Rhodoferax sp.]MDP2680748.1 hypothetical protein [Rhodoferax sp.]
MVTQDHIDEVERQVSASLRRTGVNFMFVWLLVIGIVWTADYYRQQWLLVVASVLLTLLFFVVCLPNIGKVVALNKMYGGVLAPLRKQVVLADIGAVVVLYPIAALWWQLPLATLATVFAFLIAFINSRAGGDDV